MNKPLISVIIPAYNAEVFIWECIDSIVNQTIQDWELIIVDDGSIDGTAKIVDSWQSKDPRVKVIHQANGGVSKARNMGIELAQGDYVTFVDADDCIVPQYLESLTTSIGDADLSLFPMTPVMSNKEIQDDSKPFIISYTKYSLQEGYVVASKKGLLHPPYCKCYKNETIKAKNIRFDGNLAMGEDLMFNLSYLEYCNNIIIGDNSIYYYIKGNSVLSKTIRKDYADLQLLFYNKREEFCKRHNIDFSLAPYRYPILYDAFSSIARAGNLSKKEKREALDRITYSELADSYLANNSSGSIKELLFRLVLRFPFINKLL